MFDNPPPANPQVTVVTPALNSPKTHQQLLAQTIIPAADGANTVVTSNGNQVDISGGQLSSDRANLYHSFAQLGLSSEQIANFLSNPDIRNILARVTGGDASVINGLIRVSGGNSNLFSMNPAGIVFGANSSLNVPAAFTATTATGIGIDSNWFAATDAQNYPSLIGTPNTFAFTNNHNGSIINTGNLSVSQGQNLTLLGGTVVSSGKLAAPGGRITVVAVPGTSNVIGEQGQLLSLDVPLPAANSLENWTIPITSLPQLLTGGNVCSATGVAVNSQGQVVLTGSSANLTVEKGDVVVKEVNAQNATIAADRNLTLVNSQLTTTGNLDLIANTVQVRDSIASAGENLTIVGDRQIDVFALNHPSSGLFAGGDITLRSPSTVNGDAH